ncbi:hypothetical protein [Aureivirga sp. CE67]|uniref:hypothetical protein n=1 Tax=Aureivirga sp. CE67 TaxID=1788983 RepID=UPI0018CB8FA8|nr:hypothetical protein [Aureivirga sp. CE67]
MKKLLLLFFLIISAKGISQEFPLVVKSIDSLENKTKSKFDNVTFDLKDNKTTKPTTPTFELPKIDNNISENAVDDYKVEESDKNFMNQYERDNRGVKTIQYFNGGEYGVKETTQYLGKIDVNTKRISIVFRDFGLVDSDQVKIFLNDSPQAQHINLKGYSTSLILELKDGYNKINIQAVNQGRVGPNTAELRVYDENGVLVSSKNWGLLTSQVATMVVIKN